MAEIVFLKPTAIAKVHPDALKRVNDWQAKIATEVPRMGELSSAQLKKDTVKFLSQEERKQFRDTLDKVNIWLKDHFENESYYVSPFGPEIDVYMSKIMELLKAIYQRKEKAITQKRERAATAVRRRQFIANMQPLILEAKAYLNSDECKLFENSIPGAADAWFEFGSAYRTDARSCNFVFYSTEIQNRKTQKELQQAASAEAGKYNSSLLKDIEKLKSTLSHIKDPVEYFKKNVTDPRYLGDAFSDIFDEDQLQDVRDNIQKIMSQKLQNLIAVDLGGFIDTKYTTDFFLLPSASYSFNQIPCLSFVFNVFAVISVEIWLKPAEKTFNAIKFILPWILQQNSAGQSAQLKESERLGYLYYLLTPNDLDSISWNMIPLLLIKSLWEAEVEPKGVVILESSEEVTGYQIEGFEDDIWLPETFMSYIKQMGNIDKLIDVGIISKKATGILKKKLEQLDSVKVFSLTNNQPLLLPVATPGKITKKSLAYQLFKEGKVATSPEIKALELHKSTRCKYYNQWLADGKP